MKRKAIIIGAGPAGLTAAFELLERTDIIPVIIEKDYRVGGISKTENYKGNLMDYGPHRFFSKNDRAMSWWTDRMPLYILKGEKVDVSYQNKTRTIDSEHFATTDEVQGGDPRKSMLVIPRLTRIFFLKKFFPYPIQLSLKMLGQLGFFTIIKIALSYIYIRLFPRKKVKSLEDFYINRFGKTLYSLFFEDYTEKVWGKKCSELSAEWGAQRVKGVSLSKAIFHAAASMFKAKKKDSDLGQKTTETSLIEQFIYPALGAGAIWEEVARQIIERGGIIHTNSVLSKVYNEGDKINRVEIYNAVTGLSTDITGDFFFSTMPVKELIAAMQGYVPDKARKVAEGLQYRDFVYAYIIVRRLRIENPQDSWIYIQERDVKVARIQPYNNWGDYMVADKKNTIPLGMEYFCNQGDEIWNMNDEQVKALAVSELISMGWIQAEDVVDAKINRMPKTYPSYYGSYEDFGEIRAFVDPIKNLFLVGRNGMHKYNNQDHSMLTAMVAVDNIVDGVVTKENIWEVNTEQEYHEEKNVVGDAVEGKKIPSLDERPYACFPSLAAFVKKDLPTRQFLIFSLIAILIEFVVFKYLYPFAGFINGDSYVYIQSALFNLDINTYPIGYSKFLRLFSVFTNSDTALVTFQYIVIQIGILYLLITLFYFFKIKRVTKLFLMLFLVLNPVFLYMSNYVSSDSIFLALSLVWFTSLIHILNKPTWNLILFQSLVLFLAFIFRYQALFYPIITALVLIFSKARLRQKVGGIALTFVMIGVFILNTTIEYKRITGVNQFTPFSGWQLANNAMYAYRYVKKSERKPVPQKFAHLDSMVRHYFDTSRNVFTHQVELLLASTVYMWDPNSPLNKYRDRVAGKDSTKLGLEHWAAMGPLYKDYGILLIKQYPIHYAEYFLFPNFLKYYAPPGEFLNNYNAGTDSIKDMAKVWFHFKSNKIHSHFKDNSVNLIKVMPFMVAIVNVIFFFGLLFALMLKSYKWNTLEAKMLFLVFIFWTINIGFSVLSAPVTLRYQLFSLVVTTFFGVLLFQNLVEEAFNKNKTISLKTV